MLRLSYIVSLSHFCALFDYVMMVVRQILRQVMTVSANVQFGSQSSRLGQQLLPFKVDNTMFQLLWLSYTHLPEDLNVQ